MAAPRKARIVFAVVPAVVVVAVAGAVLLVAGERSVEGAMVKSAGGDGGHARVFAPDAAPFTDVAIVLGAGPGPLLEKRMDAACALVERRKVVRLLLTGLPREMPYMRARAHACLSGLRTDDGAAVPMEEAILIDDGATRTLENLRRARDFFGVTHALVVTQQFHMARALYLADALGMRTSGVIAAGAPRSLRGRLRERFARARAVLDVALL